MKPTIIGLLVTVTLAGGGGLGYALGSSPAPNATAGTPVAQAQSCEQVGRKPAPQTSPTRALIRGEIERAPVRSEEELERYLEGLEQRARTRGKVTALEVEPGINRIQRFSHVPEQRIARFGERMFRLQQELSGAEPDSTLPPEQLRSELARLSGGIQQARDEGEKQRQVGDYLILARKLPEPEQEQALQRLNVLAGAAPESVDVDKVDRLLTAIDGAESEHERQPMIRQYLSLSARLPAEEQDARLDALNAQFASHSEPSRALE